MEDCSREAFFWVTLLSSVVEFPVHTVQHCIQQKWVQYSIQDLE